MEQKKLTKPFTISINRVEEEKADKVQEQINEPSSEQQMPLDTLKIIEEVKEQQKEGKFDTKNLVRPFSTKDTPVEKMYLILMVYRYQDDDEDVRDWEIFKGTTQELYDKLKNYITDDLLHFDVMKSRLLVDGDKSRLANNVSVYAFMLNCQTKNKIIEETPLNIDDYRYDLSKEEEAYYHGEEWEE